MVQLKKGSIVHLSHRPLHNKQKYPSIKKKRPNTIIHVTIGIRRSSHSMNNNNLDSSAGKIKKTHKSTKISLLETNNSTKTSHLSTSSSVIHHEEVITGHRQNENNLSDRKGMTNDYHKKSKRKEKKKCSRQCFVVSLLTILLLVLITVAILLALLIKRKTITTPSTVPVLRWNTTGITLAGLVGNPGSANNQFNTPTDVILDYANNLYIADYKNHRIQKYLFGSSTGTTLAGNGTSSSSQYQLSYPSRILLDTNSNLYISDTYNQRIQFWPNGAISGTTIAGTTNPPGNASNQLNYPYGIALNPTSNTLYISDYGNHRIMSYASGANNGTLVFGGTGQGLSNTQLDYPVGLYLDSLANSLIIANHVANNIIRYVLGATGSTIVAGDVNGSFGANSTRFYRPVDTTFDPMGNMYVADRNNHRIQFFYDGQCNGITIAGITGYNASNATTLNWPWAVRLDSQLNLYVADAYNHRIQKFLRY